MKMKHDLPIKKNQRLHRSFACALAGIGTAVLRERNLRIHISAAVIAVYLGTFYPFTRAEWTILILAIGLVIVSELVNTAVEHLVDCVCPDDKPNPLAGAVKDIAAGAVLVSAVVSAIVGVILFARPEPLAGFAAYAMEHPQRLLIILAVVVFFVGIPGRRRSG